MTEYVYIARAKRGHRGLVKIGYSRNPWERMRTLCAPRGGGVELVRAIEMAESEFGRRVERYAHSMLSHRALGSEWFRATTSEALWVIFAGQKESNRWAVIHGEKSELSLVGLEKQRVLCERTDGATYYTERYV